MLVFKIFVRGGLDERMTPCRYPLFVPNYGAADHSIGRLDLQHAVAPTVNPNPGDLHISRHKSTRLTRVVSPSRRRPRERLSSAIFQIGCCGTSRLHHLVSLSLLDGHSPSMRQHPPRGSADLDLVSSLFQLWGISAHSPS